MARTRGQKGFTLIEVLVSLLILAIGCLSVIIMFTISIKTNQHSSSMATACIIGERKLEEIVAMVEQRPAGTYPARQDQQQFGSNSLYMWAYDINPVNIQNVTMQAITLGIYWPSSLPAEMRQNIVMRTAARQIYALTQFP